MHDFFFFLVRRVHAFIDELLVFGTTKAKVPFSCLAYHSKNMWLMDYLYGGWMLILVSYQSSFTMILMNCLMELCFLLEYWGKVPLQYVKAVNYHNAGTVEFIVDTASGQFYFMEMNTRLQVLRCFYLSNFWTYVTDGIFLKFFFVFSVRLSILWLRWLSVKTLLSGKSVLPMVNPFPLISQGFHC